MSTNAAITRYPHVDLETLIARAAAGLCPIAPRSTSPAASIAGARRTDGVWLPAESEVWPPARTRLPSLPCGRTPRGGYCCDPGGAH